MIPTKTVVPLLAHLIDPLGEGVIICDQHGNVLTFNPALRTIFGLGPDIQAIKLSDLGGHNLRTMLIRAGLEAAEDSEHHCETVMDFEERITVDGQPRWIHVDSNLPDTPNQEEMLRMIVLRDITAEKRLEAVIGDKEASGIVSEDADMLRLIEKGYPTGIRFSRDAMRPIMNYPWPGNVRELSNMVEHSLICAIDGVVQPDSLPDTLQQYCDARRESSERSASRVGDRERIEKALHEADGNKTLAAQMFNIDRSTLWRRMQRLGID